MKPRGVEVYIQEESWWWEVRAKATAINIIIPTQHDRLPLLRVVDTARTIVNRKRKHKGDMFSTLTTGFSISYAVAIPFRIYPLLEPLFIGTETSGYFGILTRMDAR